MAGHRGPREPRRAPAAAAVILAAGCNGAAGLTAGDSPAPTPSHQHDEDTDIAIDPTLQRFVTLAVADLSARVGVPSDEISVVSADVVTWPDTSLGCPQPGMRYPQVPQDGARIHLKIGDALYRYHTGGRRTEPFLCEQRTAKPPPPARTLEPRLPEDPNPDNAPR